MRDLQHRSQSLILNRTDEEVGVTYNTGSNPSQTIVPESSDKTLKKDGEIYKHRSQSLILNCTDEEGERLE